MCMTLNLWNIFVFQLIWNFLPVFAMFSERIDKDLMLFVLPGCVWPLSLFSFVAINLLRFRIGLEIRTRRSKALLDRIFPRSTSLFNWGWHWEYFLNHRCVFFWYVTLIANAISSFKQRLRNRNVLHIHRIIELINFTFLADFFGIPLYFLIEFYLRNRFKSSLRVIKSLYHLRKLLVFNPWFRFDNLWGSVFTFFFWSPLSGYWAFGWSRS